MKFEKDPFGYAIHDFVQHNATDNIAVVSDLCEEDIMPTAYLFRDYDMMPALEQRALNLAKGRILDVGACAGSHAKHLLKKGMDVHSIDLSEGAIAYLKTENIPAQHINFFDLDEQFDTILILMNGIGIAGELEKLPLFLKQIKKCLNPNGVAYCDSTDIRYLYEEEDGSMWVDLNARYHGEMQFQMTYKNSKSDWFKWLYIDFELFAEYATKAGLKATLEQTGNNNSYLASLKHL
jgi:2-polyprenyl-3-methyl-5-hydroxy-6-metoxy-1,4-benzoquinol methylase